MIRCLLLCAAIASVVASHGNPVRAAEIGCDSVYEGNPLRKEVAEKLWPSGFRPVAGQCSHGFIRGVISKGDYENVRKLYTKNHPYLMSFFLLSPGGDVDEALKIGALFRKYLIKAWAPKRFPEGGFYLPTAERVKCNDSKCACVSACALIWFGAPIRFGAVGLHRPRTDDPAFKALSPDEASKVYRRALDAIVRYLDEMEAPKSMIDAMVATGSADILWVDAYDGLERAPSFAEWVDASCGQFSAQEHKTMLELEAKKSELLANENLLLKTLSEKNNKKISCEHYLVSSNRERLSRP